MAAASPIGSAGCGGDPARGPRHPIRTSAARVAALAAYLLQGGTRRVADTVFGERAGDVATDGHFREDPGCPVAGHRTAQHDVRFAAAGSLVVGAARGARRNRHVASMAVSYT